MTRRPCFGPASATWSSTPFTSMHASLTSITYPPVHAPASQAPPADADIQQYFCVTPHSVHQRVFALGRAGFIRRQPSVGRSIEVLFDPKLLQSCPHWSRRIAAAPQSAESGNFGLRLS